MRAKDLYIEAFLQRFASIIIYGRNNGWKYDDSHSIPPCADGKISCDRGPMRALWDLGFIDQPAGGVVVSNFDDYLTSHGWIKNTSFDTAKRGSIVVCRNPEGNLHAYVVENIDRANNLLYRYDTGSNKNIKELSQPLATEINLYPDTVAVYNVPSLNHTPLWTGEVYGCTALFVRKWGGKTYNNKDYYPTLTSQPFIKKGAKVSVLDEICAKDGKTWYYVKTAEGKHGFVSSTYIKEI